MTNPLTTEDKFHIIMGAMPLVFIVLAMLTLTIKFMVSDYDFFKDCRDGRSIRECSFALILEQ